MSEDELNKELRDLLLTKIKEMFKMLTDEERMDIMHDYCLGCGSPDTGCQCWNDE